MKHSSSNLPESIKDILLLQLEENKEAKST